jgi:hypothetical protein
LLSFPDPVPTRYDQIKTRAAKNRTRTEKYATPENCVGSVLPRKRGASPLLVQESVKIIEQTMTKIREKIENTEGKLNNASNSL